jgi:hypothetical protein
MVQTLNNKLIRGEWVVSIAATNIEPVEVKELADMPIIIKAVVAIVNV